MDISILGAPERYIKRNEEALPHSYRTPFMRDRDRIIYSKAFRRISGKTQVFLVASDDHYRTRLTHTLEVAQIARIISAKLKLNGDLTEAIALGHDLGHTPFGHVGERVLNHIMNGCDTFTAEIPDIGKGFKHNLQSVRIVSQAHDAENQSLNLSNFTLFGLYNHSKPSWDKLDAEGNIRKNNCIYLAGDACRLSLKDRDCSQNGHLKVNFYDPIHCLMLIPGSDKPAWSFEARVVEISDEIAQRHHDLEDGLESNILNPDEIINLLRDLFKDYFTDVDENNFTEMIRNKNTIYFKKHLSRFIVNLLVNNIIDNSEPNLENFITENHLDKKSFEDLYPELDIKIANQCISFADEFNKNHDTLTDFLKNRILNSYMVQRMDGKGRFIVRRLFKAFLTIPQQLPDYAIISLYQQYQPEAIKKYDLDDINLRVGNIGKLRDQLNADILGLSSRSEFRHGLPRIVCDYIAGMTDNYPLREYKRLYG